MSRNVKYYKLVPVYNTEEKESKYNNPGIIYYNEKEKRVIIDENVEKTYEKYNFIIINNMNSLVKLKESDLYTIRTIIFNSNENEINTNQKIIHFFKNKTLISLNKIIFNNFKINLDLLKALKNVKFDGNEIIRDKYFLDRKYKCATSPIIIKAETNLIDQNEIKDILNPCKDYLETIHIENIKDIRLSRLKIYLNK